MRKLFFIIFRPVEPGKLHQEKIVCFGNKNENQKISEGFIELAVEE